MNRLRLATLASALMFIACTPNLSSVSSSVATTHGPPAPTSRGVASTTQGLIPTPTDGLGFDSEPLDPGPLAPRGGHSVIWTGKEMIVWGGEADEYASLSFADGAAYDPQQGTWRLVAEAPLAPRWYHEAVWTGSEMIVVGGVGSSDGAAYDPQADSWRLIAPPPIPLSPPPGVDSSGTISSVWTGYELVIWNVRTGHVAAYDPTTDAWRGLTPPPLHAGVGVLRWGNGHLYAVGANVGDYPNRVPLLLAKLSDDGIWELLPEVGLWTAEYNLPAHPQLTAWVGDRLVAWVGEGRTVAFDPDRGLWTRIAPSPLGDCEAAPEPLVLDDRVLAFDWCGPSAIYDPAADMWTVARINGSGTRRYAVWTGIEVLSWGDVCCYGRAPGEWFTVRPWRLVPDS